MSAEAGERPRRGWLALLPLAAFAALALVFWKGLSGDPSELPSALIGKTVPDFNLDPVPGLTKDGAAVPGLSAADLKSGKVVLVNVWASWCGPCRVEHPLLMSLATRSDVVLVGIDYKDNPANAVRFLGALGQPYARAGADLTGRVAVDWGVYGVPETFIIDGSGVIRFKWVGPL